ncbi:MAG TPA: SAM-dependent methyltransferase [Jiangellales bacterium]|nr:SAM-dependent methyltransferase [Jiangellales bacterium]
MGNAAHGTEQKPATAARIYDYVLGGVHNFPADREAARKSIELFPLIPAQARANRAFLRRAVRYLADSGVRRFLDIGSGMPTEGNVHEIAQEVAPETQVVYVDLDPLAVAESLEILEGNKFATAIRGDLREPQEILGHPRVRELLDSDQPVGLLLVAVLHFVPDDAVAYGAVSQLLAALPPGSYLAASHVAIEGFEPGSARAESIKMGKEIYRQQTATPVTLRSRDQVARFFEGCAELVDPGIAWTTEWRPAAGDPTDFADDPRLSGAWAGVGRI